jgi:hypothetical protein
VTTLHRTRCEVIGLDARWPELGLTPVTLVLEDGRAAQYLAHDTELELVTRALADAEARVELHTYQLIVALDVTPEQALEESRRHYWAGVAQ